MRVPLALTLAGAALAAVATACLASPRPIGVDPMIGVDLTLVGLLASWLVMVIHDGWVASRLGRALTATSAGGDVAGVACRIIPGSHEAFVLGVLRPTMYVGKGLINDLSPRELRAVALHEEYHRRTYAPLRAAALRALLHLSAPSRTACSFIADRLADLEREADAFAMGHGSSPATLAAALVRVDAVASGASAAFAPHAGRGIDFGAAGDRRVAAVLAAASGRPDRAAPLPPLEWLVPVAGLVVPLVCSLAGLVPHP